MQGFITFSKEDVGTFFWELPHNLQDSLAELPDEIQNEIQQDLQIKLHRFALLLVALLKSGPAARAISPMIDETLSDLSQVARVTLWDFHRRGEL